MDSSRVVTRSRIVNDLKTLGVQEGNVVMMHESVRNIGWVVGGPDAVLDAVLEVLGPKGTVMKLVGSEDGTYELADWPEEVRRAYLEERPAFDPATTRACREWGILCEYLRTRQGAQRSSHPEASFAALGHRAEWLVNPHPLQHGYGFGSPLERLLEADGQVLLLGSPMDSVTLLHHAEYSADLPHKRSVRYRVPVSENGARRWVEIEELDSNDGIVPLSGDDYFGLIVGEFLQAGLGRTGTVGHADAALMDARRLHDFARAWMEREFRELAHAD